MEELHSRQVLARQKYDSGVCPMDFILAVTQHCLSLLQQSSQTRHLVRKREKEFWVYEASNQFSRPYLPELLIRDPDSFTQDWNTLLNAIDAEAGIVTTTPEFANKVLYTAIMSFSACYDLWKPSSRKTPGTFYEVLLGSVIARLLPTHIRTKHIPLLEQEESVSTDIVFTKADHSAGLVIPAKITTRERIVQPFAHQRILDSVFGEGRFKSILVCVSESQRAGNNDANEICVPGTVRLFQRHLASMAGIYYLDPPTRYLQSDVTDIIPVRTLGQLLTQDLPTLI